MVFILAHIGFWLSIMTDETCGLAVCKSLDTVCPIYDMACQPFNHRNISTASRYHCTLVCIHNDNCDAIIYDTTRHACMLMVDACFSLKSYPDHVYQILTYECTKWVPKTGYYDVYWFLTNGRGNGFLTNGRGNNAVTRGVRDEDTVVGKAIVNGLGLASVHYAISSNGTEMIEGDFERLVVDPSCAVTWVSHDASLGQPLPLGSLIGGIITATNTPLYVARLFVSNHFITGYFNPINNLAWGQYYGAKSSHQFEVMVVRRR